MAGSSSENDDALRRNQRTPRGGGGGLDKSGSSPFGRRHFPRDSGCYEGSPLPGGMSTAAAAASDPHSLDDVVIQCSKEIQKRMEQARRLKEENCMQMRSNTRTATKKGLLGGGSGAVQSLYGTCSEGGDTSLMMRGSSSSGGGALSEKSSDSGVSSSSLSSSGAAMKSSQHT